MQDDGNGAFRFPGPSSQYSWRDMPDGTRVVWSDGDVRMLADWREIRFDDRTLTREGADRVEPDAPAAPAAPVFSLGTDGTLALTASDLNLPPDARLTEVVLGAWASEGTVTVGDDAVIYAAGADYVDGDSLRLVMRGESGEATPVVLALGGLKRQVVEFDGKLDRIDAMGATVDHDLGRALFDTPHGQSLIFRAEGLPDGVEMDPLTGQLSGAIAPSAKVGEPHGVVIEAENGSGTVIRAAMDWTVREPVGADQLGVALGAPQPGESVEAGASVAVGAGAMAAPEFEDGPVEAGEDTPDAHAEAERSSGADHVRPAFNDIGSLLPGQGREEAEDGALPLAQTADASDDGEHGQALDARKANASDPPGADARAQAGNAVGPSRAAADRDEAAASSNARAAQRGVRDEAEADEAAPASATPRLASRSEVEDVDDPGGGDGGGGSGDGTGGGIATSPGTVVLPPPVVVTPNGDPTAGAVAGASLVEDGALAAIDVLSAASDPDGDTLTVPTASASNGSVAIDPDGTLAYTPDPDFSGTDTITYTIEDGNGGTVTGTVDVTVTPANDAPDAGTVPPQTLDEDDQIVSIDVLSVASDADGDVLSVTSASAANGTVTINPDGTLAYAPDPDFNGTDTITYTIGDGNGGTVTGTVDVTVTPVNDAPTSIGVSAADADEDLAAGSVVATLSVSDVDAGDAHAFSLVDGAGDPVVHPQFEIVGDELRLRAGATLDWESETTIAIIVRVTDAAGATHDMPVTIQVNDTAENLVLADGGGTFVDTGVTELSITAGAGGWTITGTASADTITGGTGDDTFIGTDGADGYDGAGGSDTVDYSTATGGVTVLLADTGAGGVHGALVNTGPGGIGFEAEGDSYAGIEQVVGSSFDDRVFGSAAGTIAILGDGNDQFDAHDTTSGDDTVYGDGGNDTINGGAGNDTLIGGDGDDTLEGSAGDNTLYGGNGVDTAVFKGPRGDHTIVDNGDGSYDVIALSGDVDTLWGIEFIQFTDGTFTLADLLPQTINGTAGDDVLTGGLGDDTINGLDGNDVLTGGEGADAFDGGNGLDTVDYSGASSGVVVLLEDTDAAGVHGSYGSTVAGGYAGEADGDTFASIEGVDTTDFDDVVFGASTGTTANLGDGNDLFDNDFNATGVDTIDGGGGNDTIVTGDGDDFLMGGDGDDNLGGQGGDDTIIGGAGTDTATYGGNRADYTITDNGDGTYTVADSINGFGTDTVSGVELFQFDDGTFTLSQLLGQTITGTNAGETLNGTAHDDTMIGLDGDDTLFGGAGADHLDGGNGSDIVVYTDASVGVDILLEDTDAGGIDGALANQTAGGRNDVAEGDTFAGIDGVVGSAHDDRVYGAHGGTIAALGDGNDVFDNDATKVASDDVTAGAGNDIVRTGAGDDAIEGNGGDDWIDGEAGTDTARYSGFRADYSVTQNPDGTYTVTDLRPASPDGTDTLTSIETLEFADGSLTIQEAAGNAIYGTTGNDPTLNGTANGDAVYGLDGKDTISGLDGDDYIEGGAGDDTIYGGAGKDVIVGGDAEDTIYAGDGDDLIIGGTDGKKDFIHGEGGDDTIQGGNSTDDHAHYSGDQADYEVRLNVDGSYTVIDLRPGSPDGTDTLTGIEKIVFGDGTHNIEDVATNVQVGSGAADTMTGTAATDWLYGEDNGDTLAGLGGDDVLDGGTGNDVMTGGAGDDTVIGGSGGDDRATYSGNRADYDVHENPDGSYTITDLRPGSPDGRDTVSETEWLDFADQSVDIASAVTAVSPIAFDLNGTGAIETTGETTARDKSGTTPGETVLFDIDADGGLDAIEWMDGSGDGLLVDNRDGLAASDMDGARLFGDQGGAYADGYAKLATLDVNGDGRLAGDELNGLELWIDDGNALVEDGELVPLGEFGIESVAVTPHMVEDDAGRGLIRAWADTADGGSILTEDVWFGRSVEETPEPLSIEDAA